MSVLNCPSRIRRSLATRLSFSGALRLSSAAIAIAAGVTPAFSQATSPTTLDKASSDNGIIVVTAQKRAEDVKNVPLSVSVLGGKQVENQKIRNFEDLGRAVPGLAVSNTGGSNLSRITLRGVSSTQGTATVGIYLDDVTVTMPNLFFTGATLPKLFDLDHVEVLRGPQGTLYGASSLGGTIRFITNKPKLDRLEGDALVDVSGTARAGTNYLLQGVVNIPIVTDKLAWRIAVQRSEDSGYVDRIDSTGDVHKGVDTERATAVRTSLLFNPSETISIQPSLLWQKTNADGTSLFYTALPRYEQQKTSGEPNRDQLTAPSLTIHGDWDALQVTSVTGFMRRTNLRQLDGQIYNSRYLAGVLDPTRGSTYNAIASLPGPYTNNVQEHQWTQEIRLGSKSIQESGHPYEWQVGLWYSNQTVSTYDEEYITGLGSTLQSIYGEAPSTVLGAPLVDDRLGYYHYTTNYREYAIFAEGSYQIFDKLRATVGLRQSFSRVGYSMDENGWRTIGLPAEIRRHDTSKPLIPKFALTYTMSPAATLYANVSKGFRLGGDNSPLPNSCQPSLDENGVTASGTFKPDSLWSYEGGSKFRFFGNRLTVNASGYYIDWKNIQQSITLPSCGYVTTVNAGRARSYGGELEVQARVTPELTLGFTGSRLDSRIADPAVGSGTAKGQWLLSVPKANLNGSLDYERAISDSAKGYFHFDVDYVGHSHGSYALTNPDYDRPSYTTLNMNLGVRMGRYDFMLYVRNLLDEDKIIQRPIIVSVRQGLIVRPRTIGGSIRAHF